MKKAPGRSLASAAVLVLGLGLILSTLVPANATHQPANKAVASGSKVEVVDPGEAVPLLTATLRASTPTDLIIEVNAECALTTNVTTVGNDDSKAEGLVRVWVEIDGKPVGVNNIGTSTTSAVAADDGKIVFCNRAYQRRTTKFDDEDATIETFLTTREASSFGWVALNVGKGIHKIVVKGDLTATATNRATAKAAVGRRTLIIQPEKLANDASI